MNLRPALRFLGILMLLLAAAELLPLLCCALYGEWRDARAFLIALGITSLLGALLAYAPRRVEGELYRREGILIVVCGWALASAFGALPYLFAGTFANPADALFEAASGFTTTGASVMTDVEIHGRGVLLWRSFTQWLGGMGIIVLFVALLPELGPGARFLYKLEVPGPTAEALHPRIHDTAAVVWKIYLGLTAAQTLLLMVAGLDLYDALAHTFATLSTGGFSPWNQSVGHFTSPFVQVIVIVFMVVAGANFSLYYGVLRGRGRTLLRDVELRLYLILLAGTTLVVAENLLVSGEHDRPGSALLDSSFQVVSIMTTTGFATTDFDLWPDLSRMLLVAVMFVGGCAGSTAGSMKVMRMVIGLKSAMREVRLLFSPNTVLSVFVGGKPVPNPVVRSVAGFFILYLSLWGTGAVLLSLGGTELVTAATASAAALGNIGPGLSGVGPTANYAFFGTGAKLLLVLLMWAGRLEIYAIAALFTRAFWRG